MSSLLMKARRLLRRFERPLEGNRTLRDDLLKQSMQLERAEKGFRKALEEKDRVRLRRGALKEKLDPLQVSRSQL